MKHLSKIVFIIALIALIVVLSGVFQSAAQPVVINGVPNAEIVIAAENRPRLATLAALELQYYIEKISGARLPIVTAPTTNAPVAIYVGQSAHTDRLGVTDEGLRYGAFRMVSGPEYLVLLGHDFDFVPPEPWPADRKDTKRALAEWDERVGDRTDTAWGYPFGSGFKTHWDRYASTLTDRFGEENAQWWPGGDFGKGLWVQDSGGSLNAVYEFLRTLGCRWYMPGEVGEVIPEQATIPVMPMDQTVRPDFAVRAYTWYNYSGFPFEDMIWARRMGMNSAYEVLGNMGYAHGLAQVHRRKEMQEAHPDYYALHNGERVTDYRGMGHACFSSEGLFRETVNFARFMFDEFDQPHISIWPVDGFRHCQCDGCRGMSSSDLVWGFVDKVARELYKTHPDRLVSCGAYTPYIHPPTNVDKFPPNVVVFIANAGRPLMDDPVRWQAYSKRVEGWREKVAPGNIMRVENNRYGLWGGGFPIIHPRNMAKDLQFLQGVARGECSEESQSGMRWHAPGKDHLTLYVQSRFMWDADRDIEAILDEYYTLFYGPASAEMREALEFVEANYSRTDKSRSGGRCNPANVSLDVRVKLGELLATARNKAGDTVHGQRIQVLIDELPPLEELRAKLAEEQQAGDPRADSPTVLASHVGQSDEAKTYQLGKRLDKRLNAELETTFKVAWDKKHLYFDIRCAEPEMSSIQTPDEVWHGDSILILLEPPGHSYYQLEVNPNGVLFDADRVGGGKVVDRWESMTDVETERGADYWRVKLRIPVAIVGKEGADGDPFNYVVGPEPTPGDEWYFNIGRKRPRPDEKSTAYVFAQPEGWSIYYPDAFAKLQFEGKQ
ncbi:MAG: DUF4838 domain-containing protein [Lentisphaerae bacterium]|nr:DUF4838 domain-containing protein [Lentisphaerota bacterium]